MKIRFARRYMERLDRGFLRSIARTSPDQRFASHIQAAIPRLQRRGWLKIVRHSDGDYVLLTDRGWQERIRSAG